MTVSFDHSTGSYAIDIACTRNNVVVVVSTVDESSTLKLSLRGLNNCHDAELKRKLVLAELHAFGKLLSSVK